LLDFGEVVRKGWTVMTTTSSVGLRIPGAPRVRGVARSILVAVAICSIAWPSLATTDQVFDKTYPLAAGGNFQLDNINGSVQVEGWDRDEVEVSAVKTADNDPHDLDQVQIDVDSQPGQVAVHTRYPTSEGTGVTVEYHVHVPTRVLLAAIKTVNGSVSVHGVQGGGDIRSVNGDVEVTDSVGRFNAKTTNGNLTLQLRDVANGAPMDIETVNGSVVLTLPSDTKANLKVQNMNGDFSSELPVTAATAPTSVGAFRAKLGTGGGEISLRTINGTIHLVRERPGA
jgi:Putative adhesin